MKFDGFKILKQIVMKREVSLGEIIPFLPKTFKDHRDFYALASLYTSGYIDSTLKKRGAIGIHPKICLLLRSFIFLPLRKEAIDIANQNLQSNMTGKQK
jgi:hypothetical protein